MCHGAHPGAVLTGETGLVVLPGLVAHPLHLGDGLSGLILTAEEEQAGGQSNAGGLGLGIEPDCPAAGAGRDPVVLASIKEFAHRSYLRDGIFAELTLLHRQGGWGPCPGHIPTTGPGPASSSSAAAARDCSTPRPGPNPDQRGSVPASRLSRTSRPGSTGNVSRPL